MGRLRAGDHGGTPQISQFRPGRLQVAPQSQQAILDVIEKCILIGWHIDRDTAWFKASRLATKKGQQEGFALLTIVAGQGPSTFMKFEKGDKFNVCTALFVFNMRNNRITFQSLIAVLFS